MRPLRLEIEGFASFRERAEVKFDDTDLFVFTGATGSGKSSVIDALGFALYGCVSRYDHASLVAPAITQGANQMRVRLDFTVGGREYTAVRVVRRTRTGATTAEARLECGSDTIAANADELTAEVEKLVGLNFEQFTKCVVLPQGDFAELLHANAKVRQDLLVRLLDIEFYRRVREQAARREAVLKSEGDGYEIRLRDLADATAETLAAAEKQLSAVTALKATFDIDEERITAARREREAAETEASAAGLRAATLRTIRMPGGVGELAARLAQCRLALDAAESAVLQARETEAAADAVRAALPDRAAMALLQQQHASRSRLAAEQATASSAAQAAIVRAQTARDFADDAASANTASRARADELLRANAAYHAGHGLAAGDDCPVCGTVLTAPPPLEAPAGLDAAERAAAAAAAAERAANQAREKANGDLAAHHATLQRMQAQADSLDADLAGKPSAADVEFALKGIDRADSDVKRAAAAVREAAARADAARKDTRSAESAQQQAWSDFATLRDPVASMGAPAQMPADLAGSWQALLGWAATEAEAADALVTAARGRSEAARRAGEAIVASQRAACAEIGLSAAAGSPRDIVVAQAAGLAQQITYIAARIAERATVESQTVDTRERQAVAHALAQHLMSNRFERWYLEEALRRLAHGASQRLSELSDGQYSLGLDGGDFTVIDHVNADETRPVKTLSGGETFLASLALALALADEVQGMAAQGSPELEALFLDEGFGTLDADTLDVVRVAISELATRGRMVGIVTHVRDLADSIPTQFRVTKDSRGSHIVRIEA